MNETVTPETEVLPAEGTQWALDWGYRAGQFLKAHAISMTVGIAIGVIICYVINNKR